MEVPSAEDVVISDGHDSQSFMILIRTVEKRKVGSWDAPTHTAAPHYSISLPKKRHRTCFFCVHVRVVCEY